MRLVNEVTKTAFCTLVAQGVLEGKTRGDAQLAAAEALAPSANLTAKDLLLDRGVLEASWRFTPDSEGKESARRYLDGVPASYRRSVDVLKAEVSRSIAGAVVVPDLTASLLERAQGREHVDRLGLIGTLLRGDAAEMRKVMKHTTLPDSPPSEGGMTHQGAYIGKPFR